jgi:hypothetical protein
VKGHRAKTLLGRRGKHINDKGVAKRAVLDIGISDGAGETQDDMASLYPTTEEARITSPTVDAAAELRDLNFKYIAEGKGATGTARFGSDNIAINDPIRAS